MMKHYKVLEGYKSVVLIEKTDVWFKGDKLYFLNGKLHREDGPAIEGVEGYRAWYERGKRVKLEKWKP